MTEIDQNVSIYAGESKRITITVKDDIGQPVDLTSQAVSYAIRRRFGDEPVLTKDESHGITVTDPTNGVFNVFLTGSDTEKLHGQYIHTAYITDISGNKVMVMVGDLIVTESSRTGFVSPTYASVEDVMSILRAIDSNGHRAIPDESTDAARSEIELLLLIAEDEFDEFTDHAWRPTHVMNEYHDTMMDWNGTFRKEVPIYLRHRSIHALSSDAGDRLEIWNGNAWEDLLVTGTEGRGHDYWVDYTNGVIYLVSRRPVVARRSVRVSYHYGETTVPNDVRGAVAKLAAAHYLESDFYRASFPAGPEFDRSRHDISRRWMEDAERVISHHRELLTGVI